MAEIVKIERSKPTIASIQRAPQEQNVVPEVARGVNTAGYVRNVLQSIPFVGPGADELEAKIRAPFSPYDYETLRRNAEESALGNIANAPYGKATSIGTNLLGNALIAYMTGGATLMPGVSALQGGIEGYLSGHSLENRLAQAGVGATIGAAVPAVLNKVLPTKGVQQRLIQKLASKPLSTANNAPDITKTIIAKSIQQGKEPAAIIAQEVPKGWRDNLWANIRRSAVGEDIFRGQLYKGAANITSKPWGEYITDEVKTVSPKIANKIGETINKLELSQLGEDAVTVLDPRSIARDAINEALRGSKQATKEAVVGQVSDAIAKRGVAKQLVKTNVAKPISTGSGSILSFARRAAAPLRNLSNLGTLRQMTTTNLVSEPIRAILDAVAEKYETSNIK